MISVKDNDTLSSLLSVELKADLLLMLSDVQGIYSGPPDVPESRLLDTFRPTDVSNIEFGDKSRVGRGGMESKVKVYTCHVCVSKHRKPNECFRNEIKESTIIIYLLFYHTYIIII